MTISNDEFDSKISIVTAVVPRATESMGEVNFSYV